MTYLTGNPVFIISACKSCLKALPLRSPRPAVNAHAALDIRPSSCEHPRNGISIDKIFGMAGYMGSVAAVWIIFR